MRGATHKLSCIQNGASAHAGASTGTEARAAAVGVVDVQVAAPGKEDTADDEDTSDDDVAAAAMPDDGVEAAAPVPATASAPPPDAGVTAAAAPVVPPAGPVAPALDFGAMTVAELKELSRERGLKVGGKKAELASRLEAFEATSPPAASAASPPSDAETIAAVQVCCR